MAEHDLSQAELFDVFSNARRRRTVQFLKRQGGSCDLTELVERVAAWENDAPPEEITRTQRRRVYISLYQTHLPMLEDHGIVDWDPDAHLIELLPNDDVFEPYLDRNLGREREWHRLYLAVAIGGTSVFALAWALTGTTAIVTLVAVAVCVVVLALSIVQHVSRRPDRQFPLGRASR
ncbi:MULTISPECIES: hypothetical protein [Natrialba]|uniref:DUF7344 domain-containing protein n=1 Tax=Natrialba swarupiae TaxID=2448032 RepID=A0A5D5ASY4_9EURY|nr:MULTISPECIES: hypothetical protein [Natrialba]MCW8172660.1 hypothetical protein [Natrialba swarupiae]MWV39559.1 hypothetical protein [Natrialba sp. INN-245]TYT62972.1 hypothetical protein FYC77_04825 [Natrialba swarupiae]